MELKAEDFVENVVIKIADVVEVVVSTRVSTVTYAEAIGNAQTVVIRGIQVPYLSLQDLILSNQTHRDQDRADVERVRRLLP